MNCVEKALTFGCATDLLIGIVAQPAQPSDVGILIIVGGPQYRVGSHRQFVQLARRLAQNGFPTMRFDYRGMGDSSGAPRVFDDVSPDIHAAIGAFQRECPSVRRVVLWGLCDAASAALMYVDTEREAPIAGIVLANPWVRSDTTIAKAKIRHYYSGRFFQPAFWAKLLRGGVDVRDALRGLIGTARLAGIASNQSGTAPPSFRDRMASGLAAFGGPILVILSGRDLTAREFEGFSCSDPTWHRLLARASIEQRRFDDADHTFSSALSSREVESATVDWIGRRVTPSVR